MPVPVLLALIGVAPELINDASAIIHNLIGSGRTETTAEELATLQAAVDRVQAERAAFEAGRNAVTTSPQVNA